MQLGRLPAGKLAEVPLPQPYGYRI
jgi:hypothetical protein